MRKKLEEIGTYFHNKVLTGDYDFISCDKYTALIRIDNEFTFKLWIGNEPADCFDFHSILPEFTNQIPSLPFTTKEERTQGWQKIKPFVLKYKKDVLLAKKQDELKKLETELNKLQS